MCCLSVRGDNPQALASGLSYVQVDKHGITFYATYISVELAHQEIFHGGFLFSGVYSIVEVVIHFTFMGSFVLAILAPQFLLTKQQVTVPTDASSEISLIEATAVY